MLNTKTRVLLCASLLVGCSTPNPGANRGRIISPDSLAVVGPLLDQSDRSVVPGEAKLEAVPPEAVEQIPDRRSKREREKFAPVSPPTKQSKTAPKTIPKTIPKTKPAPIVQTKPVKPSRVKTPRAENRLPEKRSTPAESVYGAVHGTVNILGSESKPLMPRGIILTLVPKVTDFKVAGLASPKKTLESKRSPRQHIIDMENKTYLPRHLNVQKNDVVVFANKDEIKHNVFSSSGKNAFDLGTFSGGLKRQVSLNSEGVVKVYCNIHPEMATFISVSESGYSAITNDRGEFRIDSVPPGSYDLKIWHVRGESSETVTVGKNKVTRIVSTLNTVNFKRVKHKNKFGKVYSKNNSLFDDEFY